MPTIEQTLTLEKLNKLPYAEVRKMYIPDGLYVQYYDAWEHLTAHFSDFSDENSPVFRGLGEGKRTDAVMAKAYDADFAELIGDHMAEKCRVRNRRKGDRKHKLTPEKRKEQELMRKDRMYGYVWNLDCPKKRFCPESEPIKTRKYAEGNRITREDWEIEQDNHADAMAEHYDYIRMAEDHEDRLDSLENKTGSAEYWGIMADEISREKIYESNRIKQMIGYANSIYADEEYFRNQKSLGMDAGVYQRMIAREYKEWLKWA